MLSLPTLYRLALLAGDIEAMQSILQLAPSQDRLIRLALVALDESDDAALALVHSPTLGALDESAHAALTLGHLPSMSTLNNLDLNYGDTIELEERQTWTPAQVALIEADLAARNLCLRQHPGYLRVEVAERD